MVRTLSAALVVTSLLVAGPALADLRSEASSVAGKGSVVYVVDEAGEVLLDLSGSKSFIPASTLKVFTVLLAAEHMDLTSRFATEFFLVDDKLVVRGGGDPYLISEELDLVAADLKGKLADQALSGIYIDDSFFEAGIKIPGTGESEKPYDALNSATAVNFNTIHVKRVDGKIVSAEDQTPLTPLAEEVGRARGITKADRINISSKPSDVRRYASELIAAKLRLAGVSVGEGTGAMVAPDEEPFHVHESSKTLKEVCAALLYYSTNYIANQVFLAVGAKVHGAPANLDKSVRVAASFIEDHPDLKGLEVVEGSGLSYQNKATGQAMVGLLALFQSHKGLLREKHDTPNKTGTLKVTKSVIGYQQTKSHGEVRFVIVLDGTGYSRRWRVLDVLRKHL